MIEYLILERDELNEAISLYMVVEGQEKLVCNTSYEEAGSRALDIVEQAAGNLTQYSNLRLVERDAGVEEDNDVW